MALDAFQELLIDCYYLDVLSSEKSFVHHYYNPTCFGSRELHISQMLGYLLS